jgi:hypothetical protein
MTKTGLEVLELFAEAASLGVERFRGYLFKRVSTKELIRHDAAHRLKYKAEWNRSPEAMARSRARAAIQRAKKAAMLIEIFWDGNGWYFARPNNSERLGGPYEKLHEAWKQVDAQGLEVVSVSKTRANRTYR